MSNIVYLGFKDSISLGPSPIKKPVIQEIEELKEISIGINNHIDELANLLSPNNPHFSFIYPDYTRPILPDINLTENFSLDINDIFKIEPMLFIEQVEIFSSLSQDLEKTFLDKTKDLPEPLDSSGLWSTNQKVIDRTLELAHNIPKNVADTSQANVKKPVTRGAFKSFIDKMASWKSDLGSFQSSHSRKFSDIFDKLNNLNSDLNKKLQVQTAIVKNIEKDYKDVLGEINSGNSVTRDSLLEKARELNRSIQIEKAVLNEIPTPAGIELARELKPLYQAQSKFFNLNFDCASRIKNLVEEGYLSGKPVIPSWSKKPSPAIERAQNTVARIFDKIPIEKVRLENKTTENTDQMIMEKRKEFYGG